MGLHEPLDAFKPADLPERKLRFWQMAGPGAILVGLSIGAGEIIIWPRAVAQHGASMVWAAVIGVFLQMWINFEVGRWTVATGETVYTGYARVWRGFAPLFILFNILGWLAPGWAQASGLALKALLIGPAYGAGTIFGTTTFWTVVTFGAVCLLLFGPKLIYKSVEISIEVMVLIITLGLIFVAVAVGNWDTWKELGAGIINVGYKAEGVSHKQLFIWIVFAGAGGTANLFYTFYLRDKNIGMGALIPDLQNPLRGRSETVPATGFRYADTPENASRFRAWMDYIRKDQLTFFWLLNTFTLLLFIFGSLAVLHKNGIVPAEGTLIWDEAVVLGSVLGEAGRVIFLFVGLATLFSTQLSLVDGVARSVSDILYTNYTFARRRQVGWWYVIIAVGWILAGCAITLVCELYQVKELGVLLNAAYMGGFAMAVYVPLTLYINLRYLPQSARPGPVHVGMMILATLLYTGFAGYCIYLEASARLAPPA